MATPKTPEEAVNARLKADAATRAIVADRVYPQLATQEPLYPCLTTQRAGTDQPQRLGGKSTVTKHLVDVTCFAETQGQLNDLGVAVVAALQDWKDVAARVQGCFHTDSAEDPTEDGQLRTIKHTFAVWFKAA